ncbi:MAG: M48 family metallopeptidase [Nitrospinota bacterium]|nr:M48 family metallopeptidase [Nitrospinota bacterium]
MSLAKKPRIPCPNCGFMNRPRAVQCALCGEITIQKAEPYRPVIPPPLPTMDAKPIPQDQAPQGAMAAFSAGTAGAMAPLPRPVQRSTFYKEKENNIRNSYLLLFSMTALLTLLGGTMGGAYGAPEVGAAVALVVALVMGIWTWTQGANMIMWMSGGRKVTHDEAPQLYNVVEEMKIASGLPMPEVYIIDSDAPNAFATGRDPERSAVAVTRGLLEKLDRDELQGVVAHEMAHIGNYDIRYAMMAAVLAGAIAMISDAFLRGGARGRSGPRGGNAIFLILAILLAVLAPVSAYILQMAVSRKRELLADATAVQFTRNPEGLASALAKIALDPTPLENANRATQHMYIINPLKSFSMSSGALFSTHPPTEARINALRKMGAKV